ncbi:hypothetical protein [Jingmen Myotis ricketti alphacoronavirus 1]|nr:hypothetical protein [Jingmen Myotis ricketti alphacoronavirus 1]
MIATIDCVRFGHFAESLWVDSQIACFLLHPYFVFVLLLFSFFAVPCFCMMAWGDDVIEDYLNYIRRLHDLFICALFEASLFTIFLLASFLILTWSLGYSFL